MKRALLSTPAFERAVRRLLKKQPHMADALRDALERLAEDAFDPRLETHKLKGDLAGSWACSVDYDLRIIFEFTQRDGVDTVELYTVGTHDQVY